MITEFVVDRVEHSFESSFNLSGGSDAVATATLPSIDEFVRDEPESAADADDEFMQRTSRSPWGSYNAEHTLDDVHGVPLASTPAEALEPDLIAIEDHRTPPAGSEDAIVNEIAEPADAWAASATGGRVAAEPQAESPTVAEAAPAHSPIAPEVWVAEERDAFDWHAVANLAVPPAEEQRAAEEWSATEWDRSSGSMQDHIAAQLAAVSRRVRSGELEVRGSKQMGAEAALVAALAALLSEQGRK